MEFIQAALLSCCSFTLLFARFALWFYTFLGFQQRLNFLCKKRRQLWHQNLKFSKESQVNIPQYLFFSGSKRKS